MTLFLAPFEGSGQRLPNGDIDAFRPLLSNDHTFFGSVDLRSDVTQQAGFCLVEYPSSSNDPRLVRIGANEDATINPNILNELETLLEIDLTGVQSVDEFLVRVLIDTGKIKASKRRNVKEIYIGGRVWHSEPSFPESAIEMDPTDDFNRADEDPLGNGNWTTMTSNNDLAIVSNVCGAATTNSDCAARWSGDTFDDDQFSEYTIASAAASPDAGPAVRMASGAWTYYFFNSWNSSNHLYKFVAGSLTEIGSATTTPDPTDGDEVRIEVEGSSLTGLINDSIINTGTDTSITSGDAGIQIYDATTIDDWISGNLTAAAFVPRMMTY